MNALRTYIDAVTGNAPLMSQRDWGNAPHNRESYEPIKVSADVDIRLNHKITIETDSYLKETDYDDDGNKYGTIELLEYSISLEVEAAIKKIIADRLKDFELIDCEVNEIEVK